MTSWVNRPWCEKCGQHRTENADKVCRFCTQGGDRVRHQCTVCGIPTQSKSHLCAEHRPESAATRKPCLGCKKPTVAKGRICARCKDLQAAGEVVVTATSTRESDESPWALEAGYWRNRRGIKEWVPLLAETPEMATYGRNARRCDYVNCKAWFKPTHRGHAYCTATCRSAASYIRMVNKEAAA
jgi:hypothetical protein